MTYQPQQLLNESPEDIMKWLSMINSMIEITKQRITYLDSSTIVSKEGSEEIHEIPPNEKYLEINSNSKFMSEDDSGEGMHEQIVKAIRLHYNPQNEIQHKNKRGRPEFKKDLAPDALKTLLVSWEQELSKRLKREQRSDALFASVGRYIKKIPDIFLKYIGSKWQFKSKCIKTVLKAYLKWFLKGFLIMFPKHEIDIIDLFYDFILLCFPESKATEIFEKLLNEGTINQEEFLLKKKQLKIRVKASKKSYKRLYRDNRCFQIIWQNLPSHFTFLNGEDRRKIDNVLHYLVSEEDDDDEDDEMDEDSETNE